MIRKTYERYSNCRDRKSGAIDMKTFLETRFGIGFDGVWQVKEILLLLAAVALSLLLILLAVRLVQKIIDSRKPRKDTIFSHRKNKYKDGIGKRRNRKY